MRRDARRRERGAIIPIVALLLPVLMVMTGFAVDLGRQRSDRRSMQAVADVIALDMSRLADGRPLNEIDAGSGVHPPAETALGLAAARNGVDRSQLTIDWGKWEDATGYQTINFVGTEEPNAVMITAVDSTDYYFQPGAGSVSRTAVAKYGAEPLAGFSVGSFGVAMSTPQAQLLDDILSPFIDDDPALFDPPVELDAASYEGLAGADIPLGDFGGEFGAGTPRELLDTQVSLSDFMLASARILRNQGRAAEAKLVEDSITAAMDGLSVRLGDYVNAETGAEDSAMAARMDIPSVIAGSVFQARCETDPTGFQECDALVVRDLTASIPLTTANGSVKVIESERYHYGPQDTGVDTGQIQASLQTVTEAEHVGDCQPTATNLFCLLDGLLVEVADATVTVDATVTLAGGRTSIADIDCDDPDALGLLLESRTSLYDLDLNVRVDFGTRGALGLLGTVFGTVTMTGSTAATNSIDDVLFTVAPDVLGETMKTTGAGNIGLAPVSLTTEGDVDGVFDDLAYLNIDFVFQDMMDLLVNPLLAELDQTVLDPLASLLGMNISGSDLVAQAIDCNPGYVELVQ
jgi:hypothetical protein